VFIYLFNSEGCAPRMGVRLDSSMVSQLFKKICFKERETISDNSPIFKLTTVTSTTLSKQWRQIFRDEHV